MNRLVKRHYRLSPISGEFYCLISDLIRINLNSDLYVEIYLYDKIFTSIDDQFTNDIPDELTIHLRKNLVDNENS